MSKFEVFNNINMKSISFPIGMSTHVKTLIQGLLNKDPSKRFLWKAVSTSAWVQGIQWESILSKQILPPWIPNLKCSGDSSNFVDWPKVSLPLNILTPEIEKYCQDFGNSRNQAISKPLISHSINSAEI